MPAKYCKWCGARLDVSDARFCPVCGRSLTGVQDVSETEKAGASAQEASGGVSRQGQDVGQALPTPDAKGAKTVQGASRKPVVMIAALVVAVILVAVVAFVFLNDRRQDAVDASSSIAVSTSHDEAASKDTCSSVADSGKGAKTSDEATSTSTSKEGSSNAKSSETSVKQDADQQAAIKSLNGWWIEAKDQARSDVQGYTYFNNGSVVFYGADGTRGTSATVTLSRATAEESTEGGWKVVISSSDPDFFYVLRPDGTYLDSHWYNSDGSVGYSGGESLVRTDPPSFAGK